MNYEYIYIIGKNGQLGYDISRILSKHYSIEGGGREYFDIEKTEQFLDYINNKFNIIINTAAFHNVYECENNMPKAMLYNSIIPCKIAKFCFNNNIKFIHFSTDYVFDGKKQMPYNENDAPSPLNNYGLSKYEGEKCILKVNPNAIILRVSGLYSKRISTVKGYNFITKLLEKCYNEDCIKIVNDQILTPTHTLNIAKQLKLIIENNITGIIHSTDEGEVSWFQFADFIIKFLGIKCNIIPIKTDNKKPIRPLYSVLENQKLNNANINIMKQWQESLSEFLRELK